MGVNELLDIKGFRGFLTRTAWNLSHIRYECHSRAKGSIWYAVGFAEVGGASEPTYYRVRRIQQTSMADFLST